ncbi:MAG: hypothetical protein ACRDJL_11635, partial [Actinomycetota bacterium]
EQMPSNDHAAELDGLLDQASYLLTTARTAGLSDTEKLRATLKRIRALVGDADALASSVEADRRSED